MSRAQGARSVLAGVYESTYGTAPGSGYLQLPFSRHGLSKEQPLLDQDLLGFGRDPLAPDTDVEQVAGDMTVPLDVEAFGFWLKATFGAPSTTESGGVYTHVFTTGTWDLPSMALEAGMPEVPHYEMATGVKVNTLTFDMARKGRLRPVLGLMAQSSAKATSTSAGTPTAYTHKEFLQRHGALTRAGSALGNVTSAQLRYMNNLDQIEAIRADGKLDGLDPSMAELRFDMTMRFADTTMLDDALAGDAAQFVYTLTRAAGETMTVTIPRLFLPVPKRTIEGPRGVEVTFEGVAAQQTDGGAMATIALENAVASY